MSVSLRIAYAGTPEFAVPALKALENSQHELICVITQPDRKSGRGRKISKSAVKQSITSANVQIMQPENINDAETITQLNELQLDLMVVAAYGQIFSHQLLNLPRLGCINIHASLLPKWRGTSPIQHAILSGDNETGVTIMQMVRAMDAGDIWLQSRCPIEIQDTSETLHNKLADLGGEIILEAINKIVEGNLTPTPQNESQASYCSKLKKADGLIDWREPAVIIMRKIRAFHPWPGAYTFLNGRRLRITHAEIGSDVHDKAAKPGTVCEISKLGFTVCATNGSSVVIKQLVPEGGKMVSAVDFSNSNELTNQHLGDLL